MKFTAYYYFHFCTRRRRNLQRALLSKEVTTSAAFIDDKTQRNSASLPFTCCLVHFQNPFSCPRDQHTPHLLLFRLPFIKEITFPSCRPTQCTEIVSSCRCCCCCFSASPLQRDHGLAISNCCRCDIDSQSEARILQNATNLLV